MYNIKIAKIWTICIVIFSIFYFYLLGFFIDVGGVLNLYDKIYEDTIRTSIYTEHAPGCLDVFQYDSRRCVFFTTSQANNLHLYPIAAPIRPPRDSDECRLADACNAIQSYSILRPPRLFSRRWLRYQSRRRDKQECVQYQFTEADIVDNISCSLSPEGNNISRKMKNLCKL